MVQTLMEPQIKPQATERHGRPGDSCAMVIFGATGDLNKRKLLPALYNLAKKDLLPKGFALIGCATQDISQGEFRNRGKSDLKEVAGAAGDCPFGAGLLE